MTRTCDDVRNDPAALPEHAVTCAACAAYLRDLDSFDARLRAAIPELAPSAAAPHAEQLPVAPWEGATHRPWQLAFAALALFLAAATVLFIAAGHSPASGIAAAIEAADLSPQGALSLVTTIGDVVRHAPVVIHLLIALLFVTANVILLALLRRPTRGYDAARR